MIVYVLYFIVYDVFVIHVYIIYIDHSILYVLEIRIMVGFRYPEIHIGVCLVAKA